MKQFLLAGLAVLLACGVAVACPFCNAQGTTLGAEFAGADMIVLATVDSATRDAEDASKNSSTLKILKMLKPHPAFKDAKTLTVGRYITKGSKDRDYQYILFCYVYNDPLDAAAATVASGAVFTNYRNVTVDAYRGDDIPEKSKLPDYLEATQKLVNKPAIERLAFYFNNLESNELFISGDAYNEWGFAEYKDVRALAPKLPTDTILKWMRDPATMGSRLGLYALLVGHSGKKEYAAELRKLLENPEGKYGAGLDGLLAGYILLDPQAGWDYMLGLASDRKKDFLIRAATLRSLRFFHDERPDVVKPEQLLLAYKQLLAQDDICDMAIDDLRKWKNFDLADEILGYAEQESHSAGIVKRAMLKYALVAEAEAKNAKAKEYVAKARAANAKRVAQAEELLKDEDVKPVKK
jgi:hypothetical protein